MSCNTSRPIQGNITKSRIRIILAAEYGPENVRITTSGEIHIRGNMQNTDQDGWYLWGQIGNPDTEARLRKLPGWSLSRSDADQLDGSIYDIADRLDNLVMLADGLVSYYPAIPELREILRSVKSAHAALEKAKSPVRGLWNLSMEAADMEGRS
ncbi:hypothetical protein [Methylococcus capsulatus]|uniref:hypothetical protein n=1 Tax=Methylococcus capsulatus TaxID=414 RepID=UPI001C5305E4|nr:hypothetical protein [Methylococcus capsulatus]QXP94376.1 hypothetical protein KW113_04025 [Methylococcus capsulatus]